MTSISITEWSTVGPDECKALKTLTFGDDKLSRELAQSLSHSGMLEVLELAQGLQFNSKSYVGSLRLGPVEITISPKINGMPLFHLLRYAYGLRDLKLYDQANIETCKSPFQDILLCQLKAEAQELISRGVRRDYIAIKERLSCPKGRFDFNEMAVGGGPTTDIPCRHFIRSENCLHNQVLLAGLILGAKLADDVHLRSRLRRQAALLQDDVETIQLDLSILRRLHRQSNRMTRAYNPACEIIKLLVEGNGAALASDSETVRLPGFLFDMNLFFQRLITRLMSEWLDGYRVEDQRVIHGMIEYVPGYNPRNRRSPLPRPDIVVMKGSKVEAILDVKYRDLWETALPREMLYQLAIYALSNAPIGLATIVYPTMDALAREAHLEIREPHGAFRGKVVLRPVHLLELAELIEGQGTASHNQKRRDYVHKLAFGN